MFFTFSCIYIAAIGQKEIEDLDFKPNVEELVWLEFVFDGNLDYNSYN